MITLELIERIVCEENYADLGAMFEKTSERSVMEVRHQFHYISYTLLKGEVTLAEIGRYRLRYGHEKSYDHSTIHYSNRAFKDMLFFDERLRDQTRKIMMRVKQEEYERRAVVMKASNYYRHKITNLMKNMDKCRNGEEFDELLISNLSPKAYERLLKKNCDHPVLHSSKKKCGSKHSLQGSGQGLN